MTPAFRRGQLLGLSIAIQHLLQKILDHRDLISFAAYREVTDALNALERVEAELRTEKE